jgi:hypothetical protein
MYSILSIGNKSVYKCYLYGLHVRGTVGNGGLRLPRDECLQIGEQYDECVKK